MKRKVIVMTVLGISLLISACGRYTCENCEKSTNKAYYTMSNREEFVLCEDCAREYWMPFDYKDFRVK